MVLRLSDAGHSLCEPCDGQSQIRMKISVPPTFSHWSRSTNFAVAHALSSEIYHRRTIATTTTGSGVVELIHLNRLLKSQSIFTVISWTD